MTSNTLLLLKTFLKSTSDINVLKYSQDAKKRKYAKNNLVGKSIIGIILIGYMTIISVALAKNGETKQIPGLCAEMLFLMPLMLTLLKANGYLFGFKEYDMIMSMPFSVKSIVTGKFLYMYINSIPLYGVFSLAMLIGYGISGELRIMSCIAWIIMTFFVPVFPIVIASSISALTVKISSGFKYKNIVQSILIIILILPLFFSKSFFETTVKTDNLDEVVNIVSDSVDSTSSYVPFAKWFGKVVNEGAVIPFLMIICCNLIIYELFSIIISKFYRNMNSNLDAGMGHKKYEMTVQKQNSMVKSIAFKEFKRMIGSTIYTTNVFIGQIMVTIFGVAMLFAKPEAILASMMPGAPVTPSMIFPAIPIFIYFFLGMVPTTCCSPSLEGKNYWIMQTLPIDPLEDCKGKILFNLYLTIPFGIFATFASSVCFSTSFFDGVFSIIAVASLCTFSSVYGLRCGLKHRRLDWKNEVEVIKQGMGTASYIPLHIIASMVLLPLVVVVNNVVKNVALLMIVITLIAWILTGLSWKSVKKFS